ncbi:MAG: S24 family peptidase [Bacteroidota bacterium]
MPIDTKRISRARLARALERYADDQKLSQADLARDLDVTQQAVSDWMGQRSTPGRKNAEKILHMLGHEARDLYGDDAPSEARQAHVPTDAAALVYIPHDGTAAAGTGRVDPGDEPEHHGYPARVVEHLTGYVPASELRSFTIVGDSHVPEIMPNTPAIYWRMSELIGDGLYVLRIDDGQAVKRVQRIPGGSLILSSLNPAYRDVELRPLKDADTPGTFREQHTGEVTHVQVVGKVMFYPKPV